MGKRLTTEEMRRTTMRKLLLISALLLFSTNGFTEDICYVDKYKEVLVLDHCNVGDILLIKIKPKYARSFQVIASKYCDYEKAITFAPITTTSYATSGFTCVLKTKTPRKIKED